MSSQNSAAQQWIADQLAQLNEAELLQVKAKLEEIIEKGRETVWCEAHGGLANPHFERDDCAYPHFTDEQTRERLNAARRAGAPQFGDHVEIEDESWNGNYYPTGVVVDPPADRVDLNDATVWVWVKYDTTGDVCPIRESRVRRVPPSASR